PPPPPEIYTLSLHDALPISHSPALLPAQQEAVDAIAGTQAFKPYLLHGVTGSGKTEVYLQAAAQLLAREPASQILILVPEINLRSEEHTSELQSRENLVCRL